MRINLEYLRSSFFGIEDALISTTGAVIGISTGDKNPHVILLAGVVMVTVEAISMGIGQFLTDETIQEASKKPLASDNPLLSGAIMFASYFTAGFVPVLPFFFLEVSQARIASLIAALFGLFLLGYFKAKIVQIPPLNSALKLLLLGGAATFAGVVVGFLLKTP